MRNLEKYVDFQNFNVFVFHAARQWVGGIPGSIDGSQTHRAWLICEYTARYQTDLVVVTDNLF